MVNHDLVGGIPTLLKNDGVKVSWDYYYSQYDGNIKFNIPNHQSYYGVLSQDFQKIRPSFGYFMRLSYVLKDLSTFHMSDMYIQDTLW